jgi:signal-transduction protein with cAMP-binding, CBS, and nucleotidyltransferase domain
MTEFHIPRTLAEVDFEPVIVVQPTMTIAQAARHLEAGCGALMLTMPLRVLTREDIVSAIADDAAPHAPVSTMVLQDPVVLAPTVQLWEAVRVLLDAPAQHFLVCDTSGSYVGLVTLDALMRSLLARPPWVDGLRLALRIEQLATTEVER